MREPSQRSSRSRQVKSLVGALAAVILLAACTSGSPTPSASASSQSPTPVVAGPTATPTTSGGNYTTVAGGPKPRRVEGLDGLEWVLLDYGDFVVHVFHHETRKYYELERLWSDVPRVDWRTDDVAVDHVEVDDADVLEAAGD